MPARTTWQEIIITTEIIKPAVKKSGILIAIPGDGLSGFYNYTSTNLLEKKTKNLTKLIAPDKVRVTDEYFANVFWEI